MPLSFISSFKNCNFLKKRIKKKSPPNQYKTRAIVCEVMKEIVWKLLIFLFSINLQYIQKSYVHTEKRSIFKAAGLTHVFMFLILFLT